MSDETKKQGLGGASYKPSQVFDPSKQQSGNDSKAPAIAGGLAVTQNEGTSTTAGASYYAGRFVPSNNPLAIAGTETGQPQAAAGQPVQPIASFSPAASSTSPSSGPLGIPGKAPAVTGVSTFSFDNQQLAGGTVANNSASDWSPGSRNTVTAIAGFDPRTGRTYDEQVQHAKQVNAADERFNALNMSPREKAAFESMNRRDLGSATRAGAAAEVKAFEARRDAFLDKEKNEQAVKIAGIGLARDRYKTDMHLAGEHIKSDTDLAKSVVAGREKAQQQYSDRVKGLVSGWEKLNLPTDVAPKLNYYAQIHAQAEDPKGNVFMLPPNRQGGQYAALPRAYEAHYQKLLKSTQPNDAVARIYDIAKKNGHAIDVPDFNRFATKENAAKNMAFGG